MSKRNRGDDELAKPKRPGRRLAHRRTRHDVRTTLHTESDFDDVALAVPVAEHGTHQPPKKPGRRHWKLKSWKRRTAQRRARNAELESLTRRALDDG